MQTEKDQEQETIPTESDMETLALIPEKRGKRRRKVTSRHINQKVLKNLETPKNLCCRQQR